ncbi:SRPBCC family protein [Micromonospora sp. NPDC007271]|uniref:type II toxin-antitoxin system RatA family toxin n=1 Tax=Micromonospora sp. NPDC007271 TaxID=3154587 RepID=UPI00340EE47F
MRDVEIRAFLPAADAGTVFDRLIEFERYPELVDVVRSVVILSPPGAQPMVSCWEVYFRNGILAWTEADRLRRDDLTIEFEQTDGDFDEFSGSWVLEPRDGGVALTFAAAFDFGVPTLASIIDPVAERVLAETIQLVLRGLFGPVEFPGGSVLPGASAVREGDSAATAAAGTIAGRS